MFLPFYTAPLFISNANPASFEAGLILFYFVLPSYPERELNHRYHQNEEKDEVEWHYLKAYSIAEQPEQRRNECRADIGARHLYSDYSAGVLRPEVVRRGVNDARIYRRAAETYHNECRGGEEIRIHRHEQAAYAAKENRRPRYYHPAVAELIRDKATYEPPDGDAYIKQRRECCRALCGYALDFNEICARPLHGGRFCCAVGEKAEQKEGHAFDFQRAAQPHRLLFRRRGCFVCLPYGQREEEQQRDAELDEPDDAVARVPRRIRQSVTHHERAYDGARAPETMQPAHVFRAVVERHVIVERGVDRARAQPVGDGERDEQIKPVGKGKGEQGDCGEKHADDGYDPRAEFPREFIGKQA